MDGEPRAGWWPAPQEAPLFSFAYAAPPPLCLRTPGCVVLGGLAQPGMLRAPALPAAADAVSGGFLARLAAPPTGALLETLLAEGVLLHYQAIEPLYAAVSGLIEAILTRAEAWYLQAISPMIKETLYSLLCEEADAPGLLGAELPPAPARRRQVLGALLGMVAGRGARLDPFSRQVVKGVLELGLELDALPWLDDEPGGLGGGFQAYVLERMAGRSGAFHLLADAGPAGEGLTKAALAVGVRALQYRFAAPQAEPCLRGAAAVMALLAGLFTEAARRGPAEIEALRTQLSLAQMRHLGLLSRLLVGSGAADASFIRHVLPARTQQQALCLLGQGS